MAIALGFSACSLHGSVLDAGDTGVDGPSLDTLADQADVSDGGPDVTDTVSSADAGSGVDCSAPAALHPPRADAGTATLYCPFSGGDGGSAMYCAPGAEHCCEPSTGPATCPPLAAACATGATDWQCEDPGADCPSGQQCCGAGTLNINPIPACANYASGFHGAHCAASCGAGEIRMCTSDGECALGHTCIPFKAKGNQVGGCI